MALIWLNLPIIVTLHAPSRSSRKLTLFFSVTQKKVKRKTGASQPRPSKGGKTPSSKISAIKANFWSGTKVILTRLALISFVLLVAYTAYLDVTIRGQFEGQKWALPAHVYTRPMELYIGQKIEPTLIEDELLELGYQPVDRVTRVGTFSLSNVELVIHQRAFRFWDSQRPRQIARITLDDGYIARISLVSANSDPVDTEIVRLEPRLFGSVSPMKHEDRALVLLDDVPQALIDGLIAYEDRQFYTHNGVNFKGLARVLVRAIQTGKISGGGSSLTQQLVKNYYLSSERTIRRKFVEMILAGLLEFHYSKEEILQAYINEVNLGQAGNRAIHGFGLASRYYYGRPLNELNLSEIATLVAINNAPSRYNPLRRPDRVQKKRDVVLKAMLADSKIDERQYQVALEEPLRLSPVASRAATLTYPNFMGAVRSSLKDGYQQQDLMSEGLQIHTTLNPRIQSLMESAVSTTLEQIERGRSMELGSLQAAAIVVRTDNGEIVALAGDRNSNFSGFNRAISARRPVGSLLKPFLYLTALENPTAYSLATEILDESIVVQQKGSEDWSPNNYDGKEHGPVMIIDALARSYNLAAVRLGMDVGVEKVIQTLDRVGNEQSIPPFPSVLLGATSMSVMDVAKMYLTLATGGFRTPLRSVRSVVSQSDEPLQRYALEIEQVVEPEYVHLINYAMQDAIRNGTGRAVLNGFEYDFGLAGKTGTTNDYRDSWFAGFSGNYLTVVWVGRDDNKPTGLTGASGAAKLWAAIMREIPQQRLALTFSEKILSQKVRYTGLDEPSACANQRTLPMLIESIESEAFSCSSFIESVPNDESDHFEPTDEESPADRRKKKKSFWQRIFG